MLLCRHIQPQTEPVIAVLSALSMVLLPGQLSVEADSLSFCAFSQRVVQVCEVAALRHVKTCSTLPASRLNASHRLVDRSVFCRSLDTNRIGSV